MTQFKAGQECLTRDGCKVRIYATDGGGDYYPIHGAVLYGKEWISETWTKEGSNYFEGESNLDLMPKPREFWVNVSNGGSRGEFFKKKSEAIISRTFGTKTIKVREVLDDE